MSPRARQSPVWSNGEVLDLISVWGEEAVQSQLRSSHRNYDIFRQISRAMLERGHDQDALQCRVKVKELRNANSHSSAAAATCHFYKELDAILGGDPTSMPSTTMNTSEASAARQEEQQSGSEGAPAEEDTPESLDACSQELSSSQEEGSQSRWPVLGEGQTAEEVPDATLRSQPSMLSTAERLQRIRKKPRRSKEDMLHEVIQHSTNENKNVQEWQESERRVCQQNADCQHQSTEWLISIMERQADSIQVLVAMQAEHYRARPPPAALVPKLFPLCHHVTSKTLSPTSRFLPPPAASNTCCFTTQPGKIRPLPTALNPHHHAVQPP
ncbi:uncharacterized protein LOC125632589 [Caretta caretta]|uniref:uncharacterized protein LOC125632589 n=1 Tax=Caretta caretta TaxID=8467 RepID=UPI00209491F5|nr:zinc finger and SCAN domain-containing protein 29-like isoform X2 [Caretta caretta]